MPTETKIQTASVRFDSDQKEWAVINVHTGNPMRHFSHGVMTNVAFTTRKVGVDMLGCGPAEYVGIATGELIEEIHGDEVDGFHNLSFDGREFRGSDNKAINGCSALRLLKGRRALYR